MYVLTDTRVVLVPRPKKSIPVSFFLACLPFLVCLFCPSLAIVLPLSQIAVGFNNRVWFYGAAHGRPVDLVAERDYVGSVKAVHLNARYAAVLCAGRVHLHAIVAGSVATERESRHFPDKVRMICSASSARVSCLDSTLPIWHAFL